MGYLRFYYTVPFHSFDKRMIAYCYVKSDKKLNIGAILDVETRTQWYVVQLANEIIQSEKYRDLLIKNDIDF